MPLPRISFNHLLYIRLNLLVSCLGLAIRLRVVWCWVDSLKPLLGCVLFNPIPCEHSAWIGGYWLGQAIHINYAFINEVYYCFLARGFEGLSHYPFCKVISGHDYEWMPRRRIYFSNLINCPTSEWPRFNDWIEFWSWQVFNRSVSLASLTSSGVFIAIFFQANKTHICVSAISFFCPLDVLQRFFVELLFPIGLKKRISVYS